MTAPTHIDLFVFNSLECDFVPPSILDTATRSKAARPAFRSVQAFLAALPTYLLSGVANLMEASISHLEMLGEPEGQALDECIAMHE